VKKQKLIKIKDNLRPLGKVFHLILVEVDLSKGDYAIAELYAEEMDFTYLKNDLIQRYDMSVENMELSSFGIGVYFYLDFMKSFCKIFFLLSLMMGYVMFLNYYNSPYSYVKNL